MVERHIIGLGGGGDTPEQTQLLYDYVLAATGKERPRLLYVPTAIAESDLAIVGFYEEQRRPRYRELIDGGFPQGVAADDGVAVHYVGTEIAEIVTCRPGAAAYRVTREGEEKVETRNLCARAAG